MTRSITERSKGADVPADILESIIVKIKKLEQEKEEIRHKIDFNRKIQERKRGHRSPEVIEYELNGNPSKQRNLSQINLHTSDDDDIEFIEELHIKRPHNRHSKKQRKHRSRSTSNSRMGSSNRRSRDYPLNSQPSNKYSVGKSNQSSAALVFARALSDTVKDRSDVQLVPREFSEHQPIPQHKLPLLPTPIQQQPKNLFMDNSHHWKIADQQQASHSYNLQHALSSSTPSVIQSPSLSLSMPVSLPFLNPPSTPEDLQLRMVQELALLDKEKEKLEHQKQNLFPTKSARQAPLIRAENPDRARVDEELAASKHVSSLDAAKVKQRALLERALNATRQRVEERARQLDGQKRLIQMQKDQELWKDLNICFNCAQPGHNMLHCSNQPASDVVLENAVKKAKETIFKSQQIKQQYKTRAEHYRVTRKDPFMLRLRIRVPDGLIHRDHLAQLCSRCANFGHSAFGPKACRAAKASPHLLRTISNKLVEFTKIFFFHLNDENLVDFSKKFQLYNTMDAIERGCYADPIGLNLQVH